MSPARLVMMLMTALTAFVPHSVPAGPRMIADDLDAVEIGQRHMLRFPEHASEQLRIHAASVNHHQHLVVRDSRKPPGGDRPAPAIEPRDANAVGEPQRIGECVDAVASDVFARDDRDGRRRIDAPFRFARHGRDIDLHQLFER